MLRETLFLFLLILCPLLVKSREYAMLHYTQADGLPSDNVYRVFQDKDGMLWFATDKGVSRYNGLKFENFTTEDGLPDNEIFYFVQDYEDRIWMATYNGALVYYKNGIFHTAQNTPFLKAARKNNHTTFMALQADSSLILLFKERTEFLVIKKEQVRTYILPGQYGNLSYAENTGKNLFTLTRLQAPYNHSFKLRSYRLRVDSNGKLLEETAVNPEWPTKWYSSYYMRDGRMLYHKKEGYIGLLPDSFSFHNMLNAALQTKQHLFLSTNYGLWIDSALMLPRHKVASVIQDRQGNYWIATLDNGVYKLPEHFSTTRSYDQASKQVVSFSLQEKERFIFGTRDMNLYFLSDTGIRHFFGLPDTTVLQPDNDNYFIQPFPGYYQLFSMAGVFLLSPGPERYRSLQLPSHDRRHGWKGLVYKKNCFYLSSSSNLFAVEPNVLLQDRTWLKEVPHSENAGRKYQLLMTPDSTIWLSSVKGIYKVMDSTIILQPQFKSLTFRRMIFCRNYLAGIDPFNRLILVRDYDNKNIVFDSVQKAGCVWDKFYALTDSSVLVSTNNHYRIITFNAKGYRVDILEYPFIPQLANWIHSDGKTCWFFKDNVINGISVKDLIQAPALPELRFTHFKTSGKVIPADSQVRLPYNDSRDLSLYYSTLSFNTPDINFEYSISKGNDTGIWSSSNGTKIDLYNISQGDYTVRIRALTFGRRYSAVQTLQLRIGSPFWLSWWFFLLIVAAVSFIVFIVVSIYSRRRLAKKELENKFLRSEFTALNALMNPHFVFNSLNSVQSLINKEDLEAANQYVRTISDLLRQNMHNISRELIPLSKEMELIYNYMRLEKLRFKERLQYTITVAEDVEDDFVMVPPLLIQPLVENAIKYTLAFSEIDTGRVSIDVSTLGNQVFIDVTDNGRGLNASKAQKVSGHESMALGNIKARLLQLSQIHGKNYTLELKSLKDEADHILGTRARISIEL